MPSCRYARVVSPIFGVGKSAKQMRDVHRGDDELGHLREPLGVEGVVVAQELQQVDARQVARRVVEVMYSVHGLLAVIRPDSGQVCQSLIVSSYWMPGSAHAQAAWAILWNRSLASTVSMTSPVLASRSKLLPSSTARMNSCRHADRVVRVLVLDADDVLTAEVHVEAGVAQDADLLLLSRFGLDEHGDIGMVHVEHDHLGGAAGGAAGLDRARGGVGAAHEAHRAAGGAAGA